MSAVNGLLACGPCGKFRKGEPYTLDQCHLCWKVYHDAGYALAAKLAKAPDGRPPECRHKGDQVPLHRLVELGLSRVKLWLECEHPTRPLGEYVCPCSGCGVNCPGYILEEDSVSQFEPERGKRHLLFHILPAAQWGGGAWRRAVDQLRMRWPLFTGRKIIAVCSGTMSGGLLEPVQVVREYLPPDVEVIEVTNDAGLREVKSWDPLWAALSLTLAKDDSVFYGHAKGVTRPVDPGNSCHWWSTFLYSLNLDHWDLIAGLLRRHPIVGSFKKRGQGFEGVDSKWHYSGTFYWLRGLEAVERMKAMPPPRWWWGTEAWPGMAYHWDEGGRVFYEGWFDVYHPQAWIDQYRPEYQQWLLHNPPAWPWFADKPPSAGG